MQMALEEAKLAFEEGEAPIGAVIVQNDRLLSRAHNHREARLDISSHAEIEAMKLASQALRSWDLSGCTLYVTLEPCLMCAGAILQSRISTLVYGADDPQEGAISKYGLLTQDKLLSYRGEGKEEAETLLQRFFQLLRARKDVE